MMKAILTLTDFRRAWLYYIGLSLVLGMAFGAVISGPGVPVSQLRPVIGPVQLLPYPLGQGRPVQGIVPRRIHR